MQHYPFFEQLWPEQLTWSTSKSVIFLSILDDEDDDDDDEGRQDANDYEVPPQFINRTAETLDQSQRCSTCGELTL